MNTHLLSDGSGDVHCQLEKVSGNLPPFWAWLPNATYEGNKTFHEVVYDVWQYTVRMSVLILEVIAAVDRKLSLLQGVPISENQLFYNIQCA